MAAIAGRQDIFDQFRTNKVIGAGTFNAFPVSMAAALKTMAMLERDDGAIYGQRAGTQAKLETGLKQAAEEAGHEMVTLGIPGNIESAPAEVVPKPLRYPRQLCSSARLGFMLV